MANSPHQSSARREPKLRQPMTANITGGKGSVFYRAHSYHTKVPVEGLIQLLEHYTDPGEVVLDPFCGSGQTGVAAVLTGRHAVLSDLSPAAVHIARGYTQRVDPVRFEEVASQVLSGLKPLEIDLYGVVEGRIEYTVWSDVYRCMTCEREILFWVAAVDHDAGAVQSTLSCPAGHGPFKKKDLRWLRSEPVQKNISVDGQRARLVQPVEVARAEHEVDRADIPYWYPAVPWERWREMWRAQHEAQAIATSADFFTARNLHVLSALWDAIGQVDDDSMRCRTSIRVHRERQPRLAPLPVASEASDQRPVVHDVPSITELRVQRVQPVPSEALHDHRYVPEDLGGAWFV